MREFHNITWNDILEDIFTINEGGENQKTFALGKSAGGEKFIASLEKNNCFEGLTLLLVNENGENLKVNTKNLTIPQNLPSFTWAQKKLPLLKEAVFSAARSTEGKEAFSLFQKQKGILVLCEQMVDGIIVETSLERGGTGLRFDKEENSVQVWGQNYNDKPVILLSAWDSRIDETFIHELAHRSESAALFSNSRLFKELYDFYEQSGARIIKTNADNINSLIEKGSYLSSQFYTEMFARLQEEKFRHPKAFEEQLPLFKIFYEDIVSPRINAFAHDRLAVKHFFNALMREPLLTYEQQEEFNRIKNKKDAFSKRHPEVLENPFQYPKEILLYLRYEDEAKEFAEKISLLLANALKKKIKEKLPMYIKKDEEKQRKEENLSQKDPHSRLAESAWFFSEEYQIFGSRKTLKRKTQKTPVSSEKVLTAVLKGLKSNSR